MKKLIILFFLASLTFAGFAQSLLKPVPLFTTPVQKDMLINGQLVRVGEVSITQKWIPRLNTGVVGMSFGKNYAPTPFSAIGFGISYLRYKNIDGVPFNDIGFNLLYLKNTTDNGSGIGIYGTYNISNEIGLLNVGTHYDFLIKKFLIDTGVTFHF